MAGKSVPADEPIAMVAEAAGAITILVPSYRDVTFPLSSFSSSDTPELPVFVD